MGEKTPTHSFKNFLKHLLYNIIALHVTLISLSPKHTHEPIPSFNQRTPLLLQCSTTCGIGAIWRTVTCSSHSDEDCANMKRPEPARTCELQPCAAWQSGSWSKVSNVRFPPVTQSDNCTYYLLITLNT